MDRRDQLGSTGCAASDHHDFRALIDGTSPCGPKRTRIAGALLTKGASLRSGDVVANLSAVSVGEDPRVAASLDLDAPSVDEVVVVVAEQDAVAHGGSTVVAAPVFDVMA